MVNLEQIEPLRILSRETIREALRVGDLDLGEILQDLGREDLEGDDEAQADLVCALLDIIPPSSLESLKKLKSRNKDELQSRGRGLPPGRRRSGCVTGPEGIWTPMDDCRLRWRWNGEDPRTILIRAGILKAEEEEP